MRNRLSIQREYWPEVTETPHFIVELHYEGCHIFHEDIYFDHSDALVSGLQTLLERRAGELELQGDFRFAANIHVLVRGGVELNFKAGGRADFPGKLELEGCFSIGGEYAQSVLEALIGLFRDGHPFVLEGEKPASAEPDPADSV